MKNSLYKKIIGYFLIIIIVVVGVFEIFSYYSVKEYYYSGMSSVLLNRARYNMESYRSYLSDYDLDEVVEKDRDQFYRNNNSQVQILDNNGKVIYDSIATNELGKTIETDDVLGAMKGKGATSVHKVDYSKEKVMSVSHPLNNRTSQVGIIRLSTSMEEIDKDLRDTFMMYVIFGIVVVVFAIFLSMLLAHSIINPINKLTDVAKRLAKGEFEVRAEVNSDDEIGKLAETLNFMSKSIMEKEEMQNTFISSVSHELRTPLTAIKGWAITLQNEPHPEGIFDDGLKIMEKESDRLSGMVEELLDFSAYTSGKMTINKSDVELIQVGQNIIKQMQMRADEKEINLLYDYSDPEICLSCDENRVKQVLINLLDNAIKFTPDKKSVVLKIYQDEDNVYIQVIDTGIGISKDEVDKVTQKFYKGTNSESHVGLGLSICEEIVKAHKGNLEISSVIDEGTTVTAIFPKGESDEKIS